MRRVPFATVLLAVLFCASLSAGPISGTFNIGGTIRVTPTNIFWINNNSPFTPDTATMGPGGTGDFSILDGSTLFILDLDNTAQPAGAPFTEVAFIGFDPGIAPTYPLLNLNFIFGGIYGTADCTAGPWDGNPPPQQCTPSFPVTPTPTSPFNFVNNPPAPGQATATFSFSGVTSDGLENWIGNFTSQFTVPYQQVLADLAENGFVQNTFSGTFTLTPAAQGAPEAGTMAMLGLGLVFVSTLVRRKARRKV